MPAKNVVKLYASRSVYHVYNRGNNKQKIFLESADYAAFLNLLKRHLSKVITSDKLGRQYKNWHGNIELLAFCLIPNHFHLLLYQKHNSVITQLMKSITVSYSGYFNAKYSRTGHVFQGVFRASLIEEEPYWQHISRYIHLNPRNWKSWEWSSLPYYLNKRRADWINPKRILETFEETNYLEFVSDYEDHKTMLDELKYITAN